MTEGKNFEAHLEGKKQNKNKTEDRSITYMTYRKSKPISQAL